VCLLMRKATIQKLNEINQSFYQSSADEFSDSRQYSWRGWEKIIPTIDDLISYEKKIDVLDIGCGNARFAKFLNEHFNKQFNYVGIDFSKNLLIQAQKKLEGEKIGERLYQMDLIELLQKDKLLKKISDESNSASKNKKNLLRSMLLGEATEIKSNKKTSDSQKKQFDLIVLFGVLHHVASKKLRNALFSLCRDLVSAQGKIIFTSWQFTHDRRFDKKIVNPEKVKIQKSELEENDYILDWKRGVTNYRYCHYTSNKELTELMESSNLHIGDQFFADGKSGKLNLYTIAGRAKKN